MENETHYRQQKTDKMHAHEEFVDNTTNNTDSRVHTDTQSARVNYLSMDASTSELLTVYQVNMCV